MSRRPRAGAKPAKPSLNHPWRVGVILLAGVLAYSNSLGGPFVLDDNLSIVRNLAIRHLWNVGAALRQHNTPIAGRPVVALSFAVDYALTGLSVQAYHLTNITVHLLCGLLLFGIVRRTLELPRFPDSYRRAAADLALATALLWTVHPLATEAVDYLTERTESMMALFLLLTLYGSIRSVTCTRKAQWATIAVVSCGLGMGCKESMAVAPVIVFLYDRIFLFSSLGETFAARGRLYSALAATWLVLAYEIALGPRSSSVGFSEGTHSSTYLLNQARMVVRYLRLALWPSDLVVNYGPVIALHVRDVLPQLLLIGTLLVATVVLLLRRPPLGLLGAWLFITLAPTSSVVPIATEVGAERRMYVPLMAIVALLVIGAYGLSFFRRRFSRTAAMTTLVVVASVLAAVTLARNREYASGLSLAESVLRRWPTDVAHGMVGSELAAVRRDADAIAELRLAARTDSRSRYNLAIELFNVKQFDEAIREFQRFVGESPWLEEVPSANLMMARAFNIQGKWNQAIARARMVLAMTPGDGDARELLVSSLISLGNERAGEGRFDQAVDAFRRALGVDPSNLSARHNLAQALLDHGDLAASLAVARKTLDEQPRDAGLHDLVGRILATQDRFDAAITEFEQALRLDPNDQTSRDDLERTRQFVARRSASRQAIR